MWIVLAISMLAISPRVESVETNGTSGQSCPEKKCLAGKADCVGGKCVCRSPYMQGPNNGNFACYSKNSTFGEVKNDPNVINFNHEVAKFPFLCRYLLTSINTTLRVQHRNVGYCSCVLHAWNDKYRGKMYVGGFDYACAIYNSEIHEEIGFSMTVQGIARNGHYTYTEYGTDQFLPDGPWNSSPVHINAGYMTVKSRYDHINNRVIICIPQCGWEITFLAYDIIKRRIQDQVPGLSFGIKRSHDPIFLEHSRVIATAPVSCGGTRYSALAIHPLSVTDALILRGFTSGVVQNKPGDYLSKCGTVSHLLSQCGFHGKIVAAAECFWIFQQPRLLKCLDPEDNVDILFDMIQKCIGYFCEINVTCEEYVNHVNSTNCRSLDRIPKLAHLVSGDFC